MVPVAGLPWRRRSSAVSIPWSTAFRITWMSEPKNGPHFSPSSRTPFASTRTTMSFFPSFVATTFACSAMRSRRFCIDSSFQLSIVPAISSR